MKSVVKTVIVAPIKQRLRTTVQAAQRTSFYIRNFEIAPWKRASTGITSHAAAKPPRRLLIIPSDPFGFQGAKGDEAMMATSIEAARKLNPTIEIGALTASDHASAIVRQRGYQPMQVWSRHFSYERVKKAILSFKPDICFVLGADVLDGYYTAAHSARMLLTADLAARQGALVQVLGFSINDHPVPALAPVFDGLHDKVQLNARDKVSYDRMLKFTTHPVQLVADSAFGLEPVEETAIVRDAGAWIDTEHAAGQVVVGFNLHPMLLKNPTKAQIQALIGTAASAMRNIAQRHAVSWLLIPHDTRGAMGDDACLLPLYQMLAPTLGERVKHLTGDPSAAELKGIAGLTDGVVTARMHLAIAALGQGVPVAAMVYQDKFRGLFGHFGLGDDLMIAPEDMLGGPHYEAFVERFIQAMPSLRITVQAMLPDVKALSRKNFSDI